MNAVLVVGSFILIAYALTVAVCLAFCAVVKPRGQHAGAPRRDEHAIRAPHSHPSYY